MSEVSFTKDNLDQYLKELAKEYRKRNGKTVSAEIVLIGGAAVVINYGFREMTYDMDAIINASASMKDSDGRKLSPQNEDLLRVSMRVQS